MFANDTYTTPRITFTFAMDGTNQVFVSQAQDVAGARLALSNVLAVVVDATFPQLTAIAATPGPFAATISWTSSEPATSQVDFGPSSAYGSSTTVDAGLVTSHSGSLPGLTPLMTYHFRVRSRDAAGNETVSADRTFTTLGAPDLAVARVSAPGSASLGQRAVFCARR